MKKIISTAAMICLSFSCFAEDYFVKVATDEYVLQHGKSIQGEGGKNIAVQVYTPTHIFTYPDGNPAYFRNIQKIDYTKSNVVFVKDIKSGTCCIDIYDGSNPNKCRIIGTNGFEYENFEVYEVEGEANSFTDNKQRLIYVANSGLYIVEKGKNLVLTAESLANNAGVYFSGEIIKISAIDGKREATGFDENQKEILAFNCPSDAPVSFEVEATPFMKQIEEITGVKLVTPPPSEEAALKRMAEILDVIPVELLVIDDGMVKLASQVQIIPSTAQPSLGTSGATSTGFSFGGVSTFKMGTATPNFSSGSNNNLSDTLRKLSTQGSFNQKSTFGFARPFVDNPLIDKLKGIIGVSSKKSAITNAMFEKVCDYKFDTSDEAKRRRKEIAKKPWDE